MFETVVIATDGSESASRAVAVAFDLARRFEADVHALSVGDGGDTDEIHDRLDAALGETTEEAVEADRITTAVREGDPADEIIAYARAVDADLVATGTRGRHGEYRFVLGSVAEAVVRDAPMPVLTVRQLEDAEA